MKAVARLHSCQPWLLTYVISTHITWASINRSKGYLTSLQSEVNALIKSRGLWVQDLEGVPFSNLLISSVTINAMNHVMRKPVLPYANNKGADKPTHLRSLISTFFIRFLDSIIPLVSISIISRL